MKWFNSLFVKTNNTAEYIWVGSKINEAFPNRALVRVEPYWVVEDESTRVNIGHIVTYKNKKYRVVGIKYTELFSSPKEILCPTDLMYFDLFTLTYSLNCNNPKGSTTLLKDMKGIVSAYSLPEGLEGLGILVTSLD